MEGETRESPTPVVSGFNRFLPSVSFWGVIRLFQPGSNLASRSESFPLSDANIPEFQRAFDNGASVFAQTSFKISLATPIK